ncbi:MAG: ribonucleoside triphosphate reductase [Candidatus Aenigmarchaeota archaeon]|nr:ribonucleoside triphosphate reductase [Candidatus Aenigmarchaeota archaeon]
MTGKAAKITRIRKRDGRIVDFDTQKISDAVFNAAEAVGGHDRAVSDAIAEKVQTILEYQFSGKEVPTVEEIQDIVEKVLIKSGHSQTAKTYILYRQQRKKSRAMGATFLDVNKTIGEYLHQSHWNVNDNANEAYSFSGLLLHTAGKVISTYVLNELYTPDIAEAHKNADMHIHDLTHGCIGYCAGWSLKNLLLWGFGGVPNKVDAKPAKHMDVIISQMVNYIGCLQMEFAGAQAFSSVDTLLAPFVRTDNMNYKEVKQCMQKLVFSLNIPSRWGSQYPFSNLTFDWTVPNDMKDDKVIVGGVEQEFTYGDCQEEIDMVNRAFLEVMYAGDASGRIFSFPIPTYNITKDFDWDSPNSNLLFEVTAKYGIPYFQNYVGSNLDPSSIRAMCCRLNINQTEIMKRPGNMWGPGDSTGSIGVVTLNLNRIGYTAKTEEEYFQRLKHFMVLAKNSLELKRKVIQQNLDNGLMPYTKRYLGTWKNHFSTIGLCGMHESCLNFLGKDKGINTEEGMQFAKKLLLFMQDVTREFQIETGNLYNLEATPAESTAYRFGRSDKQAYPDIITSGSEDAPYVTNSTQLPVEHTDNVVEAIEHQNEIQPLYTGGTIFHTFLGEKVSSTEACKSLVKKISHNTKLPYFRITPTFSICRKHRYIAGEHFVCPTCGEKTEVFSRIVGYFRPIQNWNKGKLAEYHNRKEYDEQKSLNHPMAPITAPPQEPRAPIEEASSACEE